MPDAPRQIFENAGGMNLVTSPDLLGPGSYPYLCNTRKLLGGRITARPPLGANLIPSTLPASVTSLTRLNDPYGAAPYYARIVGAAGVMYVEAVSVATGLSGNPLSFLPYRPSQSPRPWCYVGDPSLNVLIDSQQQMATAPVPVMSSASWTNPANATSTTVFTNYASGSPSGLTGTVASMSIPAGATITGIKVSVIAFSPAYVFNGLLCGLSIGSVGINATLNTNPTGTNFGGSTWGWGIYPLTPAVLNAGFQVLFYPEFGALPSLNSLTVTVYYTIPSTFACAGMVKVRSDGLIYKTGIAEPQVAPAIVASTIQGVISVTIVSPGSGQTPGTYSITGVGGGGTGATIQIVISSGGTITSALITNAGSGYTSIPSFPVSYGGVPGVLSVTIGAVGPNWVTYRYVYRSSITGAVSNPSPESPPQIVPQTSISGSEVAATAGMINSNITINSSQYEGSGAQIRTTASVAPGTVTDYIVARNFGLSVPAGVNIDGVLGAINWQGQYAGTGVITSAALFYQGQILGQVKAPGITNQQSATTSTQGGNSDNWGTVLTPTIVNDSTFGIGFQVTAQESGGSDRSFFNNFSITVYYTTLSATVTATPSPDPQVDTIDYSRMDPALDNFTYVGSTDNTSVGFSDTQSDLAIAGNPILSFANYEPFPSIDLPRKGVCTVTAATVPGTLNVTAVTGDVFNTGWLPGNLINIAGIVYTLYNRPSSSSQLCAVTTTKSDTGFLTYGFPPATANVPWFITVPTLAAEPSPVIWGPTPDNAGSFYFGLDPNNQGDLLWSTGNNFDSASDTNRLYVTSPNEQLMNGTVTSELSTVFSTDRFWLIYPNFADAVAAVTGTLGSPWTLVQSASSRGLYMRYAICALGAETGWRAKDGIFISLGGGPEKEISTQIYNLFPHSGQLPSPVVIGGNTVYPPDDTNPKAQTMALTPGYLFYNYQDTTGTPRTLVYDKEAKGWSVDVYTPTVNYHAWVTGAVNQTLVGCTDGTVRALDSSGAETGTAIVATPCINGGSPRTVKRIGGVFLRALAAVGIGAQFWKQRYATQITGTSPSTTATNASETDYLFDFTGATGADCLDLSAVFSFPLSSGNWLKEWQPDWTSIPEQIVAWRTGMLSYGLDGWLHIPWLRFAYSSTTSIALQLITDQGVTIALTIPSSGGNPAKFFTWVPATVSGASTKFKMVEWVADAGGSAWTCYGADMECAIKAWGSTSGYKTIKPFRKTDGSST